MNHMEKNKLIMMIVVEIVKQEKSVTAQSLYANLSTYHKIDLTVERCRIYLSKLVKDGKISVESRGHGSVRKRYCSLKKDVK